MKRLMLANDSDKCNQQPSLIRVCSANIIGYQINVPPECQSVKQFRPRPGPTFCRAWSRYKQFAKVNGRLFCRERVNKTVCDFFMKAKQTDSNTCFVYHYVIKVHLERRDA